jgi:hypothetical protein
VITTQRGHASMRRNSARKAKLEVRPGGDTVSCTYNPVPASEVKAADAIPKEALDPGRRTERGGLRYGGREPPKLHNKPVILARPCQVPAARVGPALTPAWLIVDNIP